MNTTILTHLTNLHTADNELQNQAYYALIEATNVPVDWAYEVWDELVLMLRHKDNHLRAISAQLLCNLAKSDPDKRILNNFGALLAVSKDERFVTARHCLQALWKVGAAGKQQQEMLVVSLAERFAKAGTEKNGTLVRFDIAQGLRTLYDTVNDESIRTRALALIETEADPKYRKKYARVWRTS